MAYIVASAPAWLKSFYGHYGFQKNLKPNSSVNSEVGKHTWWKSIYKSERPLKKIYIFSLQSVFSILSALRLKCKITLSLFFDILI
jgi:hypothetical protein